MTEKGMISSQNVAIKIAEMIGIPTDGLTKIQLYCDNQSFLEAKCEYEIYDKDKKEVEEMLYRVTKDYRIFAEKIDKKSEEK